MYRKKTFLLLLLTSISVSTTQPAVEQSPVQDQFSESAFDPLFDDPALDRFLNPNQAEEEYVYSIEQPPPPGRLLVWLRIIGVPIINAFFSVRRVVRESIAWILAKIKNDKQDASGNAQN